MALSSSIITVGLCRGSATPLLRANTTASSSVSNLRRAICADLGGLRPPRGGTLYDT